MRSVRITCALALAALVACSKSATQNTVAACLTGFTQCGDNCVNTTSDAEHCGGCGNVCSETGAVCRASTCIIPCETQLRNLFGEVGTDAAGYVWPKAPMTNASEQLITYSWSTGRSLCDGVGPNPRLPTATELYRLSQDATLRPSSAATVWALTADGSTRRYAVTVGGSAIYTATAEATSARHGLLCTCAPPAPAFFSNQVCMGGSCFTLATPKENLDAYDRPSLTKAAAIWECGFYGGHLPSSGDLAAAVALGVPHGTNDLLTVNDEAGGSPVTVAWSASNLATLRFDLGGDAATARPFRCAGPSDAGFSAPTEAGVLVPGPGGPLGLRGDLADSSGDVTWVAAIDACWAKGGHLPAPAELYALVIAGLPDGSGQDLWTGDLGPAITTGPSAGWWVSTFAWSESTVPASFPSKVLNMQTTAATGSTLRFRCMYYPIDPGYAAPTTCEGGCQAAQPSGKDLRVWIDQSDRTTATFADAAQTCALLGGRIPTVRDYAELIRNASLTGNGQDLWTADFNGAESHLVRWSAAPGAGYSPSARNVTQAADATAKKNFRCLWTNELR